MNKNDDNFALDLKQGKRVSQEERRQVLNQEPRTIWLTGLSAAGKSTLAYALERALIDRKHACYVLDGDLIRRGLNNGLGFSKEERRENIRRTAEAARLMNDAGLIVIAALISPSLKDRALAREIIGPKYYREVYVSTSLAICEQRDPKGLYSKARTGELLEFPGISLPYEEPSSPDTIIDMARVSLDKVVVELVQLAIS